MNTWVCASVDLATVLALWLTHTVYGRKTTPKTLVDGVGLGVRVRVGCCGEVPSCACRQQAITYPFICLCVYLPPYCESMRHLGCALRAADMVSISVFIIGVGFDANSRNWACLARSHQKESSCTVYPWCAPCTMVIRVRDTTSCFGPGSSSYVGPDVSYITTEYYCQYFYLSCSNFSAKKGGSLCLLKMYSIRCFS